jgi:hypothetical protein
MSEKRSLIEQMLEHLVNDEQQKAEELFHEYVVTQSREIYETLIESEIEDSEDEEKKKKNGEVEEGFDEFGDVVEADDDNMDLDSEDPTDNLANKLGDDEDGMDDGMDGDMDEKSPEELFQDLDSIVDELQAKFDAINGNDMGSDMGSMGDDEEMKDDFELETVREYVEKVPSGHGAEKKGQAEKADGSAGGLKFSKNDMGGTAGNILSGRNGAEAGGVGAGGTIKGSALSDVKPKDMNTGNLNKVGGFKGDALKKNTAGHGAERKGAAEGPTEAQGLFRGRR